MYNGLPIETASSRWQATFEGQLRAISDQIVVRVAIRSRQADGTIGGWHCQDAGPTTSKSRVSQFSSVGHILAPAFAIPLSSQNDLYSRLRDRKSDTHVIVDCKTYSSWTYLELTPTREMYFCAFSSAVPSQVNPSIVADFQLGSSCHCLRMESSNPGS